MVVLLVVLTMGAIVGPSVVGVAHLAIVHGPMVEPLVDQTMGAAAGRFAVGTDHLQRRLQALQAQLGSGAPRQAI